MCRWYRSYESYQGRNANLVNIASQYSDNHHYLLQPLKSVVIPVKPSQRKKDIKDTQILLNENEMPVVDKSAHLGILRWTSCKTTENETTDQNIAKARRAAYSLMSTGLHGQNGLGPITSSFLIRTFIQPILTYDLEIILPTSQNIEILEKFQRQTAKKIPYYVNKHSRKCNFHRHWISTCHCSNWKKSVDNF